MAQWDWMGSHRSHHGPSRAWIPGRGRSNLLRIDQSHAFLLKSIFRITVASKTRRNPAGCDKISLLHLSLFRKSRLGRLWSPTPPSGPERAKHKKARISAQGQKSFKIYVDSTVKQEREKKFNDKSILYWLTHSHRTVEMPLQWVWNRLKWLRPQSYSNKDRDREKPLWDRLKTSPSIPN